jgi:hypothetical protein
MNCQDGFEAEGEIRLLGAHITGQLGLNGAHVTNSGGYTLAADWLTAAGVFCPDFVAEGEMRLLGAHIAGQLSLIGAHLINPGAVALTADILTVEADWSATVPVTVRESSHNESACNS